MRKLSSFITKRSFGVEIECIGLDVQQAKELLFEKHNINKDKKSRKTCSKWHVKHDGSIKTKKTRMIKCTNDAHLYGYECFACGNSGYRKTMLGTCEIVSPILSGENGLEEVKRVCRILKQNKIFVNESCGLHVHVNAKNISKIENKLLNVFNRYAKFEKKIDKLIAPNRRANKNNFCRSLAANNIVGTFFEVFDDDNICNFGLNTKEGKEFIKSLNKIIIENKSPKNKIEKKIQQFYTDGFFNMERYAKVNLAAYDELGSVEFRHHHGSIDPDEVINWIKFCVGFFNQSMKKLSDKDNLYLGIDPDTIKYYKTKSVKNIKLYSKQQKAA